MFWVIGPGNCPYGIFVFIIILLQELDEKINIVAAKVVHLGDQLESVNGPRSRADEALQLMQHFNEFLSDQPLESEIFMDPDRVRMPPRQLRI